jgi:endonuclease YncB( thermonuclease family)
MTKTPRHLVMPTLLAAAAIAFTATELAGPQPVPTVSVADGDTTPVVVPADPKQPITHDWPW